MKHCKQFFSSAVGRIDSRPEAAAGNKGFTLIELLVVVAIIGVLAMIIIPSYNKYVTSAKTSRAMADIRTVSNEIAAYTSDNGGTNPSSLADINRADLLDPWLRPYVYYNFAAAALPAPAAPGPLMDILNLEQLNKDFDLYSLGPDGLTAVVSGVQDSLDDIVRFSEGAYVGLR